MFQLVAAQGVRYVGCVKCEAGGGRLAFRLVAWALGIYGAMHLLSLPPAGEPVAAQQRQSASTASIPKQIEQWAQTIKRDSKPEDVIQLLGRPDSASEVGPALSGVNRWLIFEYRDLAINRYTGKTESLWVAFSWGSAWSIKEGSSETEIELPFPQQAATVSVARPAAVAESPQVAVPNSVPVSSPAAAPGNSRTTSTRPPTMPAEKPGTRSRDEIERIFDANKGSIYALYNGALRNNPSLGGKVVLKLTITADGRVSTCEVVSSELDDPELEKTLVQRVLQLQFEPRNVDAITITKPIDFFPA
jgi:TonB family protein